MADWVTHAGFREKVQDSFDRQGLMKTLGGRLRLIEAGRAEVELPYSDGVTQQHGYSMPRPSPPSPTTRAATPRSR